MPGERQREMRRSRDRFVPSFLQFSHHSRRLCPMSVSGQGRRSPLEWAPVGSCNPSQVGDWYCEQRPGGSRLAIALGRQSAPVCVSCALDALGSLGRLSASVGQKRRFAAGPSSSGCRSRLSIRCAWHYESLSPRFFIPSLVDPFVSCRAAFGGACALDYSSTRVWNGQTSSLERYRCIALNAGGRVGCCAGRRRHTCVSSCCVQPHTHS